MPAVPASVVTTPAAVYLPDGVVIGDYQKYARGIPITELQQTGTTESGERHGTKITFHPDPEIFKNVLEFSFEQLSIHDPASPVARNVAATRICRWRSLAPRRTRWDG